MLAKKYGGSKQPLTDILTQMPTKSQRFSLAVPQVLKSKSKLNAVPTKNNLSYSPLAKKHDGLKQQLMQSSHHSLMIPKASKNKEKLDAETTKNCQNHLPATVVFLPKNRYYCFPESYLNRLKSAAQFHEANTIENLFFVVKSDPNSSLAAGEIIFDLYTGQELLPVVGWQKQLGQESLAFYSSVRNINDDMDGEKPEIPLKILLMAAFEAKRNSKQQIDIFNEIKDSSKFINFISENVDAEGISLLNMNRLITSVELDAVTNNLMKKTEKSLFCSATKITDTDVLNQNISNYIQSRLLEMDKIKASFIPLLFRSHWILYGMVDNGHIKRSVVFDSFNSLNTKEKNI